MNRPPPPVVTISATYGSGGGFVGPRVAERLGVRFVERAISVAVAEQLAVAEGTGPAAGFEVVEDMEDGLGSGLVRWLSSYAALGEVWAGVPFPDHDYDESAYRAHVASVLRQQAAVGAVILGRGGQVVLRDCLHALHVRLDGPVERRIAQAVDLGGIDPATAHSAQQRTDAARNRYFHRLYRGNLADPRYYHLVIDATSVPWATCVDIIVAAVEGRAELRRLGEVAEVEPG
jgi:cytidylate kinase